MIGDFTLLDIHGSQRSSQELLARSPKTLLLFLSATCASCQKVINSLESLATRVGGLDSLPLTYVLLCWGGGPQDVEALVQGRSLDGATVLVDKGIQVYRAFGLHAYPTALLVDGGGSVLDQINAPTAQWLDDVSGQSAPKLVN